MLLSALMTLLPAAQAQHELLSIYEATAEYGTSFATVGDLDGDGATEIVGANLSGNQLFIHSSATGEKLADFIVLGTASGASITGLDDVNGDGIPDFAVGAPNAATLNFSNAGEISIFSGADLSVLYTIEGQDNGESLGRSIANAGDVDGDGVNDILAGAPNTYINAAISRAGRANLYSGVDGSLIRFYSAMTYNEQFGEAVDNAGDLDGDGIPDQIVGGPSANSQHGLVRIYSGASGGLLSEIDGPPSDYYFGEELRGLGQGRVAIGAPRSNLGAGNVSIYEGPSGTFVLSFAGDPSQAEALGHSVDSIGDFDGDGIHDLIVGSPRWKLDGKPDVGRASVFSGADGTSLATFEGSANNTRHGWAVAAAGDLDGDSQPDAWISATLANTIYLVGFNPYIEASATEISAATGGTIDLALAFPPSNANKPYRVLFSATGAGPTRYGVDIPLTRDSLTDDSYFGSYPFANASGMQGVLDSQAEAAASFTVASGLPSGLIGRSYWCATIVEELGSLPSASSADVVFTIVP